MTADVVKVVSPVEVPALDSLVREGEGAARAIVWPGVGALLRAMHLVSLRADGATRELRHRGEAVYYVISGGGRVRDPERAEEVELTPGAMVHVEPQTPYAFVAGSEGLELVGGPGPADPACYDEAA